ncbi:hypothetical protein GZ998_08025 [Actinomyces sp. 594]|uniref:hypothetical protein n=1 Tax=Actinomyces sp. 594 TaxID=2057793 RepID=UPI001C59C769|nr:hypothetical protein [Actinomyces sp. 594]MBW3069447.1 hypothetical protein [Actinomyces sp. 594]
MTAHGNSLSRTALGTALALSLLLSACSIGGTAPESASATPSSPATGAPTGATTAPLPSPGASSGPAPSQPSQAQTDAPGAGPAQPGDAGYVLPEADPVELDGTAESAGTQVSLSSMQAVDAVAGGVGEVSGPALEVEVSVTAGEEEVDLSVASVELTYGDDQTPAVSFTSAEQAHDLPAKVGAGQTVTGTYVFAVPTDARDRVDVKVTVSTGEPVVVFRGAVG